MHRSFNNFGNHMVQIHMNGGTKWPEHALLAIRAAKNQCQHYCQFVSAHVRSPVRVPHRINLHRIWPPHDADLSSTGRPEGLQCYMTQLQLTAPGSILIKCWPLLRIDLTHHHGQCHASGLCLRLPLFQESRSLAHNDHGHAMPWCQTPSCRRLSFNAGCWQLADVLQDLLQLSCKFDKHPTATGSNLPQPP